MVAGPDLVSVQWGLQERMAGLGLENLNLLAGEELVGMAKNLPETVVGAKFFYFFLHQSNLESWAVCHLWAGQ